MSKTAIIFGGCGFFGTHFARSLSALEDYSRVILADVSPPREHRPKVEYVWTDVRQDIQLEVDGEIEIYNFAAVHTNPGHEDWEYYWSNIKGAVEVCRFARRTAAKRIVFTSTMAVYGPQEQQVDERTPPNPVTAYGKSKLLAEKIHEDWQREDASRRLVIARPAVTFGPGEHGNFTRLASLLRRSLFAYPARKDTIKSCAPIVDFADSVRFMSSFDEPSIHYIYAYPDRTTIEQINRAFYSVAGFRLPQIVIPERLILSIALAFEILSKFGLKTSINRDRVRKLIFSTNVYPHELTRRGWIFRHPLNSALRHWKAESDFQ